MQDSATIPHGEFLKELFSIAPPGTFVNFSGRIVNSDGTYLLDEKGEPEWSDRIGNKEVGEVGDSPTEQYDRWFTVHPRSTQHRGKEGNTAGVVAIPFDFDFVTSSDAKDAEKSWRSIEEVRDFCDALPIQMSALIDSGNGVHGYVFLSEPLDPGTGKELIHRVHAFVKGQAKTAGRHLDSVNDLARVMRLPGTMNRKDFDNPKPVTVIEMHRERRSGLNHFDFIPSVGTVAVNTDTTNVTKGELQEWVNGLPVVQEGRDLIDGWVAEMTGATPGHLEDGRRPTAMSLLGKITVAAEKGLTDFRAATTEVGDAFVGLFDNEDAADREFTKMAENVVAYRVADAAEDQVEAESVKDGGGTPIPLSRWRIIDDESPAVASYRYRLTTGDKKDLIVGLSRVNTLTSPVTAQVEVQVPASDEPIVERNVYISNSQSTKALAGRLATGPAGIQHDDLFIVLRYLFNRVVAEAEVIVEMVNLATVEIAEADRILMFEQDMIDGAGVTTWYGKGGTGKTSMGLGVAVDCSSCRSHETSFLGRRYREWRPFLFVDYEESRDGAGENVFKTKVDAICKGAEIDRSEVAVHLIQPKSLFAQAYVEVARRRDELTEMYGIEPVTIIDSMQGASGNDTQSTEATAGFLSALDAYGGITIVLDHEAESNAGKRSGKQGGKSVKTQRSRLGVHFHQSDMLNGTTMTVKKANHAGGRVGAIGSFTLDEKLVGDPSYIDTIRFDMSAMKDRKVDGTDRPRLTNGGTALVWAHLTGEPISSKSFDAGGSAEKVFNKRVESVRNRLGPLAKEGLLDKVGSKTPIKYRITDDGTKQAKELLTHYPEILTAYQEQGEKE